MNDNPITLYETLFKLASEHTHDALFGANAPQAYQAFQRALLGNSMPTLWYEIPLSGKPRFDLHVAHSNNAHLYDAAPYSPEAMDNHGNLLNWYVSQPREGGGLALAYDVSSGNIDNPAVHVNVNGASCFDAEGVFTHVDRADATALYNSFIQHLPQGWHLWYFGVHPSRPGAPVRVDCFVDKELERAYAHDPSLLQNDLQSIGFSPVSETLLRVGAEVAVSPFNMELQFDVLGDALLGHTMGISAGFPFAPASSARPHWEAQGAATSLMRFAEQQGVADTRWQYLKDTLFTLAVQNNDAPWALYCVPVFIKFRIREGALLDAKVYLQAGARSFS